MTNYSIVQKSQLEGALRLDAEYYQPEYLNTISNLKNQKAKSFSNFLKLLYRYPTFYNLQYYKKGVLVLKGEDILPEGFIENQSQNYISKKDAKRFPKTNLKEGDLIFSVRGYVGKVGIVDKKYDGSIISANLIRAVVKDASPYFLWVFLNSQYGTNQISRVKMITAQETIIADDIKNFLIPPIAQDKQVEIEKLAKQSISELRNGEHLYSQAENLLLEELGLKDFRVEDKLSYIINLSGVKSAHRADAEYFQPKYEKLISKIKKQGAKLLDLLSLNEIFSIRRGDFINPDYYVERAKRGYIRIKELPSKGDINLDAITYIDDNFSDQNLGTLLEGDFVFAGIGATLGKTARIPKELEGSFYSNNTARFRVRNNWGYKVDTHYLQVVFQSIICQWQFEQKQAQTAQAKIADEELKTVLIPILPKLTQQKIADLVCQSHEARQKAKELLKEAKRRIEELIEMKN